MKVNGIRAVDYHKNGDQLSITFTDATFEQLTQFDTSSIEIRTDDNDIVASYVGMSMNSIQYDAASKTFTVVTDRTDRSATAVVMQSLRDENTELRRQLEENSVAMMELAARVEEVNTKADEGNAGLIEVAGMVAELYSTDVPVGSVDTAPEE